MPVQSTGNWGAFSTKMLALREVAGSHDVVLKFSGKWHGIANLHTIQFLHREDRPATLPATAPAGVTRQEAGLPLSAKRSGT
jgi:hypothetical protein